MTVGGIRKFMFISSITGSIGINHVIFYILLALSENSRGTLLKTLEIVEAIFMLFQTCKLLETGKRKRHGRIRFLNRHQQAL